MSKIYRFREWLTIPETARRMSISFDDDVTEADVLRLALDRRLQLSVNFVNHAKARCGKVITWEETDWWLPPRLDKFPSDTVINEADRATTASRQYPRKLAALYAELPPDERNKFYPMMRSLSIDGERFVTLSDDVVTLQGVWDLPMIGGERLDVEHRFQSLTGGPAVTLTNLDGAFVEGLDGTLCQLQEDLESNEYQPGSRAALERLERRISDEGIEPQEAKRLLDLHSETRKAFLARMESRPKKENYYPSCGLPKDAVLVVRTDALRKLERSVNDAQDAPEKPLTTIERNSLLTIIAVLCGHSGIDIGERGTAAQLARITEEAGTPVSYDTVRRALARIPEALESRTK